MVRARKNNIQIHILYVSRKNRFVAWGGGERDEGIRWLTGPQCSQLALVTTWLLSGWLGGITIPKYHTSSQQGLRFSFNKKELKEMCDFPKEEREVKAR